MHATVDVIYSENRSSIGRNGSARESHDLVDSLIVPGGKEEESEGEYKISNINDSGKKIRDEGYKISNISWVVLLCARWTVFIFIYFILTIYNYNIKILSDRYKIVKLNNRYKLILVKISYS